MAKDLQLKEDSLKLMIALRDSASLNDSLLSSSSGNFGYVDNKMVCTQSSCSGSVLGDTKVEQWLISAQNKIVIVQAMNNKMQFQEFIQAQWMKMVKFLFKPAELTSTLLIIKWLTINVLLEKKGDNSMEAKEKLFSLTIAVSSIV